MPNIDDAIKIDVSQFESKEFKENVLNLLVILRHRAEQLDKAEKDLKAATDANIRKGLERDIESLTKEKSQIRKMLDAVK